MKNLVKIILAMTLGLILNNVSAETIKTDNTKLNQQVNDAELVENYSLPIMDELLAGIPTDVVGGGTRGFLTTASAQ